MGVGIADTELALTWDAEDLIFNSDSATNQLSKLRWREGDKLLHRNAWKAIHFSLWASISSVRARDRLDPGLTCPLINSCLLPDPLMQS